MDSSHGKRSQVNSRRSAGGLLRYNFFSKSGNGKRADPTMPGSREQRGSHLHTIQPSVKLQLQVPCCPSAPVFHPDTLGYDSDPRRPGTSRGGVGYDTHVQMGTSGFVTTRSFGFGLSNSRRITATTPEL